MEEEATQLTQGVMDPRRIGDESPVEDSSDVICMLHPCTPAAMRITARIAAQCPQHIFQAAGMNDAEELQPPDDLGTFILPGEHGQQSRSLELALRFSSNVVSPGIGFLFGRNKDECDFCIDVNENRRISAVHFRIFLNDSGVLMLQDLSTNGTVVNQFRLRAKGAATAQTRMLRSGDIIQVLQGPEGGDVIQFIVRVPSRTGCEDRYMANIKAYIDRASQAAASQTPATQLQRLVQSVPRVNPAVGGIVPVQQPIRNQNWGMHWDGSPSYNVSGLLGKGAFATVYLLTTKSEGHYFAAKELEKRRFVKDGVLDRRLENELQIMKDLKHRNIVQFVDYMNHTSHLYIIMEYVGCGDLQGYINNYNHMPESIGKTMAAQVFGALDYLHYRSITHRDIKPDNILIANDKPGDFWVKLTDFGLSKVVKDNETLLKTFCGTLLYCAPEVFPYYDRFARRKRSRSVNQRTQYHSYSKSVDIWSFGAVLWYALCGQVPFAGVADATGEGMFNQIMNTRLVPDPLLRVGAPPMAWDLLAAMLNTDPSIRPTARQCRQHCWFSDMPLSTDEFEPEQEGLAPLIEDEEPGRMSEPDLSQLRLNEDEPMSLEDVGITASDLEFLDPRESKRIKEYTSPDRRESAPARLDPQNLPQRKLLFGEIQDSTDNPSCYSYTDGSMDENISIREVLDDYRGPVIRPDDSDTEDAPALTSLTETEEMPGTSSENSPQTSSIQGESDDPVSPQTPPAQSSPLGESDSSQGAANPDVDTTPKPAPFNRRIDLPLTASYFYDPHDPKTHNPAYASALSGHDFLTHPTAPSSSFGPFLRQSASPMRSPSAQQTSGSPQTASETTPPPPNGHAFVRPPPRLGRLVSTSESFVDINIPLSAPIVTWGRAPNNIAVYPNDKDVRIPKRGLILAFGAADFQRAKEAGEDWTKLPDLHCMIATEATLGISVNGVKLAKTDSRGRPLYGLLHNGDTITIVSGRSVNGSGRGNGLEFKVEIYHGLGKEVRPTEKPFRALLNQARQ